MSTALISILEAFVSTTNYFAKLGMTNTGFVTMAHLRSENACAVESLQVKPPPFKQIIEGSIDHNLSPYKLPIKSSKPQ